MPLRDYHRELLFDYSLGLASENETAEAQGLLETSQEAQELYELFVSSLSPLGSVEVEPCPDELTERLFSRLSQAAGTGAGSDPFFDLVVEGSDVQFPDLLNAFVLMLVAPWIKIPVVLGIRIRATQQFDLCNVMSRGHAGIGRVELVVQSLLLEVFIMTLGELAAHLNHLGADNAEFCLR